MEIHDSEDVHLFPGQCVKALCRTMKGGSQDIGFFVRPIDDSTDLPYLIDVQQRGGLVKFNDVLLVLTILKINDNDQEIFDVWWNYHAPDGPSLFKKMSEQENVMVHLCDERGTRSFVETPNSFKKFFDYLLRVISRTKPWTEIEFDRSVAGFCAQSYPKASLWEMVQSEKVNTGEEHERKITGGDYPGFIPLDLREFYIYSPDKGHCIKIIPSILEMEATKENPEQFLRPAPVKTVLRCGFRWLKGYPVAPIPFIPSHGLAIPPEDLEF